MDMTVIADAWQRRVHDALQLQLWVRRTPDGEVPGVLAGEVDGDPVVLAWSSRRGFERAVCAGAPAPVPYLQTLGLDLAGLLPASCGLLVNQGMANPLLITPDDLARAQSDAATAAS